MSEETPIKYDDNILTIVDMYSTTALNVQSKLGTDASSIAALGSILEEYNDRFESGSDIFKQAVGDGASYFLNRNHEDVLADYNYVKSKGAEWRANLDVADKARYSVMFDVGAGNVQIYTAIELLEEYGQRFPSSDPLDLKKYNLDYARLALDLDDSYNTSTVKFASLMVEKGLSWGAQNVSNWNSLDALEKEAFSVYFYNVGEDYLEGRRDAAVAKNGVYNVDIDNTDIAQEYLWNYSSILERMLPNNERLSGLRELIASGQLDDPDKHCFLAGTMIDMWPLEVQLLSDGRYDEAAIRAEIWQKPIEEITPNDWVVSFDKQGKLKPGKVAWTFTNESKIILDFHGTFVTPGHVYYCAGGKYEGRFAPLIDILRDDGVIRHQDGTLIRASTGCEVGSPDDEEFWAFSTYKDARGVDCIRDKTKLRFGTRWMLPNGQHFTMREYMEGIDMEILPNGYAWSRKAKVEMPFCWVLSDTLPKPEDFVLARSGTTLEDIYHASEWETQRPTMPPPMVMDGGPVQRLPEHKLDLMPRNQPMAFRSDAPSSQLLPDRNPQMNRRQRKEMEAKARHSMKTKRPKGVKLH